MEISLKISVTASRAGSSPVSPSKVSSPAQARLLSENERCAPLAAAGRRQGGEHREPFDRGVCGAEGD